MWDLLKKTDIEQAKQELKLRHAETLRRHAEESQNLDADRVELETLNELIDTFVQKLSKPAIVHAPISPPVSTPNSGAKTSAETKTQKRQHDTVYASYMRAMTRV
jgi:hypothetical protein